MQETAVNFPMGNAHTTTDTTATMLRTPIFIQEEAKGMGQRIAETNRRA